MERKITFSLPLFPIVYDENERGKEKDAPAEIPEPGRTAQARSFDS